jgi:hypothetical protein
MTPMKGDIRKLIRGFLSQRGDAADELSGD